MFYLHCSSSFISNFKWKCVILCLKKTCSFGCIRILLVEWPSGWQIIKLIGCLVFIQTVSLSTGSVYVYLCRTRLYWSYLSANKFMKFMSKTLFLSVCHALLLMRTVVPEKFFDENILCIIWAMFCRRDVQLRVCSKVIISSLSDQLPLHLQRIIAAMFPSVNKPIVTFCCACSSLAGEKTLETDFVDNVVDIPSKHLPFSFL